jgi:hypothetical protein
MAARASRARDLREEERIKTGEASGAVSKLTGMLWRRRAVALLVLLGAGLLFYYELDYGGLSLAKWLLYGSLACGGGGLLGLLAALLTGGGSVARVGCGSWDCKCCSVWCTDACGALFALTLSFFTVCALGALIDGSLAVALMGAHHVEHVLGYDLPDWLRIDLMIGVSAVLGVAIAVRFYYKTRQGWWRGGEALTDNDDANDWHALL